MMTTLKMTRVTIEQIARIEVEEPKEVLEKEFSQRYLIIWTKEGEMYELILKADEVSNLEFKKVTSDWLSPKLYKPKVEEE